MTSLRRSTAWLPAYLKRVQASSQFVQARQAHRATDYKSHVITVANRIGSKFRCIQHGLECLRFDISLRHSAAHISLICHCEQDPATTPKAENQRECH